MFGNLRHIKLREKKKGVKIYNKKEMLLIEFLFTAEHSIDKWMENAAMKAKILKFGRSNLTK